MRTARFPLSLVLTELLGAMLLCAPSALPQNISERYGIGISLIHPQSCPLIVGGIGSKSPAESAGVTAGERLLAVNGTDVAGLSLRQATNLLGPEQPGVVSLKLWKRGVVREAKVEKEKLSATLEKQGSRIIDSGRIVPLEATDAQIQHQLQVFSIPLERMVAHPFPAHFPKDPELYHGGFALLVYKNPAQVIATGLELEGPAARAGLWQGDIILSLNGTEVSGKSPEELLPLFARATPDKMSLKIERARATNTIEFTLEKVSDILTRENERFVDGRIVPAELADEDIHCFEPISEIMQP